MSLLLLFGSSDSGQTIAASPAIISVVGVTPALAGTGAVALVATPAIISVVGVTPTLAGTGAAAIAVATAIITLQAVVPLITGGDTSGTFGLLEGLLMRRRRTERLFLGKRWRKR